ncbi:MAG: DEAD/DEAH box helicase [Acidobacteria bacterium]|nr:DEAD/DEAH box helicase [Acidobacteriota bacterium]
MPLSSFHPAVAEWFESTFSAPTEPQRLGWPAIQSGEDTLIAAPTGSGKTLAAFLAAIDSLVRQGIAGTLTDETQVVYISPLKALSNDIKQNLTVPLTGVRDVLLRMGLLSPEIRVWVRTGDTPAYERQKMLGKPPHILVTTPESLYILLTAEKSRRVLRTVRTVIVDEIHAVARDKRGSHLALTLERLDALASKKPVRIGLSATQKPIEEVARFLVGTRRLKPGGAPRCTIIDIGHARKLDLAIEVPGSPLSAVCSNETWEEIYDRIAALIRAERTTLVFVNTRRLAERVTLHLSKRLGEDKVTAHHGSLSRVQRLRAEQRLKAGELQALVATASLELGIDIGTVDLVCQIGSPRSIATFLQRVGRSGHTPNSKDGAVPRGRIFALSRDELVECAALLRAVRRGRLDRLNIPEKPLDILAQQIVAAAAAEDGDQGWGENELYELCHGAFPYRRLTREEFDEVVQMLAEGFSTRRGRSAAHLHYDGVGRRIRARKGARLAAITSGGAIPDNADYRVILEPEGTFVGTVNEDFAIESMAGDIFQLGNSAWRILRVELGQIRVADARGESPTIPFWLGEAPARTAELSSEVSELREEVEARLDLPEEALRWLQAEAGVDKPQAEQITEYLGAARKVLGVVPTQKTIVLERFFDTSGGMQLVVHAPFGGRINRAWGLALRKRFCRSFNFELQAAASDEAIVLSLGPQHSFPLEEVFSYLHTNSAEDLLVQALLAAPMFQTRWRWNAMRSLAILRHAGGKKVPAAFLRMRADDLLVAVFPDSAACAENLSGPIEVPDHPLVRQTVGDCLREAMDIDGFLALLRAIEQKKLRLVARDTTEPSPLSHEILNAKPYAFLDDAPLEERRARAVEMRRSLDFRSAEDLGRLDSQAIETVRQQAWPEAENPDELHDALMLMGFLGEREQPEWEPLFQALAGARRAARLETGTGQALWIAAERKPQFDQLYPGAACQPAVEAPAREQARDWSKEEALVEIVRGRLEALGPVTVEAVAGSMGLAAAAVEPAVVALEKEGFVLRGHFTGAQTVEWCERRLLARIHRATLDRLRKEIEPVTAAEFMRFLFAWQHAETESRLEGPLGLSAVVGLLQGFEIPAAAWEGSVLPSRMVRYDPVWLDQLCLSGELAWARLSVPGETNGRHPGANRASPVSLLYREQMEAWLSLAGARSPAGNGAGLGSGARQVLEFLQRRGACFFQDLVSGTGLLRTEVEDALRELIACGWVTGDGFAGLRALVIAPDKTLGTSPAKHKDGRPRILPVIPPTAGRWSVLGRENHDSRHDSGKELDTVELWARQLLRRYGVVFHRLLEREGGLPPWRELLNRFRRLEARGEIRGGRFVAGFSGEQFALPEAIPQLRATRRKEAAGRLLVLSAADPLNLAGITTPGRKIAAVGGNRVLYRDGIPLAAREGGSLIELHPSAAEFRAEIKTRLAK